jgi:hypothetical protein
MAKQPKTLGAAMVAAEMADADPDTFDQMVQAMPTLPTPAPEPVPAPAPMGLSSDAASLVAALVAALQQSNVTQAESIKAAVTLARAPIPENAAGNGMSVYAHPLGDNAQPRTPLACSMFLGVYNQEGVATAAYEYEAARLTEEERVLLNQITPGVRPRIQRSDGMRAMWRVVDQLDSNGQPIRRIIAVPETWLSKEQFHQMPQLTDGLKQLIAAQAA